jgi:phosphoesterase RecJ-like protein
VHPRTIIAQTLRSSARVLIVCHEGPDGDCLGAALALRLALQRLGITAVVASPDGVPPPLRFLPGADEVVRTVGEDDRADVAVTMECSSLDRTGPLEEAVRRAHTIVAIDHHADLEAYAHLTDWNCHAAAVAEQVADLIDRLGVPVDRAMAVCLLTALVTDTGVFRYANVTARALRLAADLTERGAAVHEIVRAVYEEQPLSSLRLQARALERLSLHAGGSIIYTVITSDMLATSGATPEATSGIAALLRTVAGVRVAMTFEESGDCVRVSIRSRDGARADRIARALGGGGHAAAAGADVRRSLEETIRMALEAAESEIEVGRGGVGAKG